MNYFFHSLCAMVRVYKAKLSSAAGKYGHCSPGPTSLLLVILPVLLPCKNYVIKNSIWVNWYSSSFLYYIYMLLSKLTDVQTEHGGQRDSWQHNGMPGLCPPHYAQHLHFAPCLHCALGVHQRPGGESEGPQSILVLLDSWDSLGSAAMSECQRLSLRKWMLSS